MMSLDSWTPKRWARTITESDLWWEGKTDRPLIPIVAPNETPAPWTARQRFEYWQPAHAPSVSTEEILEAEEQFLSRQEFLADACPMTWFNYGPGVVAAFLGAAADFDPKTQTVWFHAKKTCPVKDLDFVLNQQHPWYRRLEELYRLADLRWQGRVQVGMTDLGGNLDILYSFRSGEELLFDLYDDPSNVERLTWQAHEAWWKAFDHFRSLTPHNPGFTNWASIFSSQPTYMLQCDFAYMISPDMFDRFVKPEISRSCQRLGGRAFYHLDGVGQLPHLDSLLSIPELAGVQWVSGTGSKKTEEWPEVFGKILKAGKKAQFIGSDIYGFDKLVETLGSAKGFVLAPHWCNRENLERALRIAEKFGVPV